MGRGLCQPCSGNKLTLRRSMNNQWLPNIFLKFCKEVLYLRKIFAELMIFLIGSVQPLMPQAYGAIFLEEALCKHNFTGLCLSTVLKIMCYNHSAALKFKVVVQLTFTQRNFSSLVEWWEECVEQAIPCTVSWHSVGLLVLAQPTAEPRAVLTVGQHTWSGAASPGPPQGPLLLSSRDVTLRQILSSSYVTVILFSFGKVDAIYLKPALLNPNTDIALEYSSIMN